MCSSRARCEYRIPGSVLQALQPTYLSGNKRDLVYSRPQVLQAAITHHQNRSKAEQPADFR